MSEDKPKDTSNRDMAIRSSAMDMAIRAGCANCYDLEGRSINSSDQLVSSASQIEQYIKNGVIKPVVESNLKIEIKNKSEYD